MSRYLKATLVSIFAAIFLCVTFQSAYADDRAELKQNVKWAIWHEGCRVYAPDNQIGNITQIRQCVYGVQSHNPRAQSLIANATDNLLLQVVQEGVNEIPGEFQLPQNFEWVAHHEGQIENFRVWRGQGNYEAIRGTYQDKQNHNPNARNLLAGVNNAYISNLIDSM